MRTVVLFNSDLSGGAGKFILTLANAFQKLEVNVHVIIYNHNVDYAVPKGIAFHKLVNEHEETQQKKEIANRLKTLLDSIGEIDLIMSNSSPSNTILSMLQHPRTYHCVHSAETKVHKGLAGFFKAMWRTRKYKKLYSHKNLITVSKELEAYILHTIGGKPKSIQTIYNPFDFKEIEHLSNAVIEEIPKEPYLIHIGRFDMVSKRQDILLKAYKQANVPFKLILLGEGEDKAKLEALVKELGLGSKVIFHGYTDNPFAWLKHAKLFVFSSDFEGFGRVLAEALIVGTPVVSTNCPTGPKEILTGVLEDFLVPAGDVNALAEKIKQALTVYPDVENIDMSWLRDDVIAKQYIGIIDSISKHENVVFKREELL